MKYKKFKMNDLFIKLNLKCLKKDFDKDKDISKVKNEEFNLPLVNAKHGNNGIMYYGRKTDWEYDSMCLDIVNDGAVSTGDVYPQPQETGVLYNAYLIKPKIENINEEILIYLSKVIEKVLKNKYSYDNKAVWEKVKNDEILLPSSDDKIPDYDYITNSIRLLKSKNIDGLCKFLIDNDLNNFDIKEYIEVINNKNIKYKKFKLDEIFYSQCGDTDIKKIDINNKGIMVVSSGDQNQGIIGKTDIEAKIIDGNSITVDMFGGTYYRESNYKMVTHARVFSLESKNKISREVNIYYTALLSYLKQIYSYQNMCSWNKIKNDYILIPVDDYDNPNYEFMENYIRVLEKKMINKFFCSEMINNN